MSSPNISTQSSVQQFNTRELISQDNLSNLQLQKQGGPWAPEFKNRLSPGEYKIENRSLWNVTQIVTVQACENQLGCIIKHYRTSFNSNK
jgi:hypothetical protein